jgi:hybrid polyketide synthase/nonribosomal peptide synthetase FtdB
LLRYAGLDSLSAFELKARIESELRIGLPARHFLQSPSLDKLAREIADIFGDAGGATAADTRIQASAAADAPAIDGAALPKWAATVLPDVSRRSKIDTFPVSVRQRNIVVEACDPTGDIRAKRRLVLSSAAQITPRIDVKRLRDAARTLSRRHKLLHANFAVLANEIVHVFGDDEGFALDEVDARDLSPAAFNALLTRKSRTRLDLAKGPLWGLTVFRLRGEQDVVLLRVHNALVDGWSLFRLWQGLIEAYFGYGATDAPDDGYGRFVIWQRRLLDSEDGERQRRFWLDHLGMLPKLPNWNGRSRDDCKRGVLKRRKLLINCDTAKRIATRATSHGVTNFSTLLTAYLDALRTAASLDHVVVTVGTAGRTGRDMSQVFGPVANSVHLKFEHNGECDFASRLVAVHRTVREGLENQDYPSAAIEAALREAGVNTGVLDTIEFGPIYPESVRMEGLESMMFATGRGALKFGGMQVEPLELPGEILRPDIRLRYQVVPDGLYCIVEYDSMLIEDAMADSVLHEFRVALERFAGAPQRARRAGEPVPAHAR